MEILGLVLLQKLMLRSSALRPASLHGKLVADVNVAMMTHGLTLLQNSEFVLFQGLEGLRTGFRA